MSAIFLNDWFHRYSMQLVERAACQLSGANTDRQYELPQ